MTIRNRAAHVVRRNCRSGPHQPHHVHRLRGVGFVLAGLMFASACTSASDSATSTVPTTKPVTVASLRATSQSLALHLSEGRSQGLAAIPISLVQGDELDATAVAAILARLTDWTIDDTLSKDFNWPVQTLPPPRTGQTIDQNFPPADTVVPIDVPTGPLKVLRYQPEGDVAIAPFVSITFNQPMVPLGTVSQLADADVPAIITPTLAGRWQWIGTRTLRFDYESDLIDRLPMATDYTVEIPAGTTSVTGGVLADAVSWKFATPPITVQSFEPTGDSLGLDPVFVATFDQRIDPAAVLATITLKAGDADVSLRLATNAEVAADDLASQLSNSAGKGRWLAFRAQNPLPRDTAITITIGPGTPSAEGPVLSAKASTHRAHTYAPLKVNTTECGYGPSCPPGSDILITFNNALDTEVFDASSITIEPALAGFTVGVSGNTINVRGVTQGRTTYTVTIPAHVSDLFGQTLGEDTTVSVDVGSAAPMIGQFALPLITVDPLVATKGITVSTINHAKFHVRVFAVEPSQWPAFQDYMLNAYQENQFQQPPSTWPVLLSTDVVTNGKPDQLTETNIDLTATLAKNRHVVVLVEPTEKYSPQSNDYWSNRPTATWVQSSLIGVDAFVDNDEARVWTTDLRTGAALAGVSVEALGRAGAVTTDSDGLAKVALSSAPTLGLVATLGDDSAVLSSGSYGGSWQSYQRLDESRWYVFDDRQIYRPGETVSMKGWVRQVTFSTDAQLRLIAGDTTVRYTAFDAQGNQMATGTAAVNALGGFNLSFDVGAGANLGYSNVSLNLENSAGVQGGTSHQFRIEEFRRPEFEVVARHESAGPFVSSQPATVAVDANYYSGGPLGAAKVDWSVTTSPTTYAPPGWDDFSFGVWTPWWLYADDVGYGRGNVGYGRGGFAGPDVCCFPPGQEPTVERFSGTTDADGTHYLQIDFGGPTGESPDLPVTVTAQSTVQDVNRQAWSSDTSLIVHPGDFYVGLRGADTFVRPGEPLDIQAIVTDIDGKVVSGRAVTVTASRLEWKFAAGAWTEVPTDTQTCNFTSAAEAGECSFETTIGGTYTVRSIITDDRGGKSRSELTRWVSGGEARPTRNVEQQSVTVVPDKAEYRPGDTAELLVQAPFATAEGLLTVSRNGIASTIRFQVEDGSAIVPVPLADADIPNVDVTIEVVGATTRTDDQGTALPDAPTRPAYAVGNLTLPISLASRELTVSVTPRDDAVAPGATTQVDVQVTDSAGAPVVGAEFSVVVVDEAVLALSNYELTDPLATFYSRFGNDVYGVYGRGSIVLADPGTLPNHDASGTWSTTANTAPADELAQTGPGDVAFDGARTEAGGNKSLAVSPTDPSIDIRGNFDALALFAPSEVTDASGKASLELTMPDNLTRYRVMVVAISGADRFGKAEANITARLPLMVRPSAPRFLNFGDNIELPVIVQNQTDAAMVVELALQTANLDITGATGRRVTVPANDRIEVRFEVAAAQVGTARFRIAGVSGDNSDAAIVEFPVYTPATTEAFATYGVIDDGAVLQPVLAPTDVYPQFGSLDITTSSTSLQALTDAVLYISQYPYESSDALASRILTITALRDVLEAFDAAGLPTPAQFDSTVKRDIKSLTAMINFDGGFPFWGGGSLSDPYNSIQVTHALVMAKAAGYSVPQSALDQALAYLAGIEQHFTTPMSAEVRDTLSAYALYVRHLAGAGDPAKADALYGSRGKALQLDALAWLWPTLTNTASRTEIARTISNKAVETAGAANFVTTYGDDASLILQSDRRTDGVVLGALISEQPASDLIPKVVNGLLAGQTKGRWDNIQENAFILLALKSYFDTYESQTPDFVAKVWLGDRFAGEHAFVGRSTDRVRIAIPTAAVIAAGDTSITLSKDGAGRLYYRLGLRYAPTDLQLDPLDRGFVVSRSYEAVDDSSDVSRDADGTWHVKAGARVRVRLTMVSESQRAHVALIDPLPAGFEILNPALATTQQWPEDPQGGGPELGEYRYWAWTWFDHQNMRDDRAEAFAAQLGAGVYDYSYVARATTPGSFVAPPARAEEMYSPETFGRGSTDMVVVDG